MPSPLPTRPNDAKELLVQPIVLLTSFLVVWCRGCFSSRASLARCHGYFGQEESSCLLR